jgi:hypothetical protein
VTSIRKRLERLDGGAPPRLHVVRSEEQERKARGNAAARNDQNPTIIWRLSPCLDGEEDEGDARERVRPVNPERRLRRTSLSFSRCRIPTSRSWNS